MRKSSIEKRIPLGRLDIPNTHEITFEHHVTTSNKYDVIKLPIKPTPVYPSNVKSRYQYSPLNLYTQIFTERKEPSTNALTIENTGINTTLSNTLRRKNIPQCISPLNKSYNELRTMASLSVSRDASIDMPTQTTPLFHVLRNSRDKRVTSNPVENITDKENNSPIIPVCHVTEAKVKYERTPLQQQQLGNIASLHNTLLSPLSSYHPEITMRHTSSNKEVSLLIVV